MLLIKDIPALQQFQKNRTTGGSLGFVPTMGALHIGHTSLMTHSIQNNDLTIASIFLNPTQFERADDFKCYPKTLDNDLALLEKTGVDACFCPDASTIYNDDYTYQINENKESQRMEGKHRPGHFNGMLTVVMKLLNLVKPTRAYFGEKDYQQFLLIRQMTKAFFMDVDIEVCKTIREPNGLAYSSRNMRLSPEEHKLAIRFAQIFHQALPIDTIHAQLKTFLNHIDYIEEHNNRRFAAVHIGAVRLIDNYPVSLQEKPVIY